VFFVAELTDGTPVGQVRFNIDTQEAVISVSLGAPFRGKGLASTIIRLASDKLFEQLSVSLIHAYIKLDNVASAHAFQRAGYQQSAIVDMYGAQVFDFVLRK
jgi:RimJ/RimL family protein N-acetyltransferase